MGNFISRLSKLNPGTGSTFEEKAGEYSWDKGPKLNLEDYSFINTNDEVIGKLPGSINGQQFTIQNCVNSVLYVFDHMNSLTIDDCNNCTFILGPVKESLFIRDCKNCVCVASSGQFRARDCSNMDIFLCCPTQPTIESSIRLKFNCLQFFYNDFSDHMHKAGLSPFNNSWSHVHDFTPGDENEDGGQEGDHWSLLSKESIPQISPEYHMDFNRVRLSFSWEKSVVPYTLPPSGKEISLEVNKNLDVKFSACLAVFTVKGGALLEAPMIFARAMRTFHPNCRLTSSKEVFMRSDHPFAKNAFGKSFSSGVIVGLRFFGPFCWEVCNEVTDHLGDEDPNRKQHIFLKKCSLKELYTEDDFFSTPIPYVPAFYG